MKRALAAVGDTEAAPGSTTKASFQKKKGNEGRVRGFFFLSFTSSSIQPGIEELLESRRKTE